jgi:Uma2 family endonuclease
VQPFGIQLLNPDLSWVAQSRWEVSEQFCPVAPDFVLEYSPDQDRLAIWQDRMVEYRRLGVKLGLLVNLQSKQVEIYRPGREVEVLEAPASIAFGKSGAIKFRERLND